MTPEQFSYFQRVATSFTFLLSGILALLGMIWITLLGK